MLIKIYFITFVSLGDALIMKDWKYLYLRFMHFTDLDKLDLVKISYGGLILGSCQAASNNGILFKRGQNRLKYNHLSL